MRTVRLGGWPAGPGRLASARLPAGVASARCACARLSASAQRPVIIVPDACACSAVPGGRETRDAGLLPAARDWYELLVCCGAT
jgi:hypothetical protein